MELEVNLACLNIEQAGWNSPDQDLCLTKLFRIDHRVDEILVRNENAGDFLMFGIGLTLATGRRLKIRPVDGEDQTRCERNGAATEKHARRFEDGRSGRRRLDLSEGRGGGSCRSRELVARAQPVRDFYSNIGLRGAWIQLESGDARPGRLTIGRSLLPSCPTRAGGCLSLLWRILDSMRRFFGILTACVLGVTVAMAQSDRDFSGLWKLNSARSELQNLPAPPDAFLKVEQNATTLTVAGTSQESVYPLDGRTEKRQAGDSKTNTVTKWEGAALLVNTLVSGPQNYTVMERWKLSRDRSTLTIKRTVVRISGESESLLVYENPASAGALEVRQPARPAATHRDEVQPAAATSTREPDVPAEFLVEAGTRVLLRLTNSVNTKHTATGDRVYLETAFPIYVHGHLVIPRGSYVAGTVTDSHQAGRVKGRSGLSLRFESLTLPNGVVRDFRSRPGSVDTKGNLDRSEGKIEGEGNKGGDARTVGKTTAAGAGIGTVVGGASGHYGMGAAVGAAAGAAAGLAGVLSSRGPDVVLPRGTTMEMVLDRDLRFTEAELRTPSQ